MVHFYFKNIHTNMLSCSLQFKEASSIFSKGRAALSGKVGGMKVQSY